MASNNKQQPLPEWAPQVIILSAASIAALFVSYYLITKLAGIITLLLISLFLSFALEPVVNILVARGWKRGIATGTILLVFVVSILVLIVAMIPLVVQQINEVFKQGPSWVGSISEELHRWFGITISQKDIIDQISKADGVVAGYATSVAGNIFGISRQLFYGLFQAFGVLLFTFYFVADAPHLRRVICSFLPPKHQIVVLNTWELAIEKTGGYMISRALLGALSAGITLIVLLLLGAPFALPLALWVGIVSQFLPVVGTYLAASLPLAVALIAKPSIFFPLLIFIIVYQQIENYIFAPRITAKTMEMHPAIAFGAVVAGASVAGIIGALLALPLAAILQESFRGYFQKHELVESKLLVSPVRRKSKNTSNSKTN